MPLPLRAGMLTTITCGLGAMARGGKGGKARPTRQPVAPLEFWGYEASPFVKVSRVLWASFNSPEVVTSWPAQLLTLHP